MAEILDLRSIKTVSDLTLVDTFLKTLLSQKERDIQLSDYGDTKGTWLDRARKNISEIQSQFPGSRRIRIYWELGRFYPGIVPPDVIAREKSRYQLIDSLGKEYRRVRRDLEHTVRDVCKNEDLMFEIEKLTHEYDQYLLVLRASEYSLGNSLMKTSLYLNLMPLVHKKSSKRVAYIGVTYAPDPAGTYGFFQEVCRWKDFPNNCNPSFLYEHLELMKILVSKETLKQELQRIIANKEPYAPFKIYSDEGVYLETV